MKKIVKGEGQRKRDVRRKGEMVRSGKKEEKGCGEKVSKGQGRVSKIRIRNGEESNDLPEGQDVKKMFS